uniref:Triadin-like n=1 Tax=Petromyzon marinus TaxID=7757 RepID=A0AAJ7X287_PETMA|nr:triadin-like [Petromyzon marinus]
MTDPSRGEGAAAVADGHGTAGMDASGGRKVVRRVVRRVVETSPLLHSPSTWMLAFALLLTWGAVAVVMFDVVDLKVYLGQALDPDEENDGTDEETASLREAAASAAAAAAAATDEHESGKKTKKTKKTTSAAEKKADAAKGTGKKNEAVAGSGVKGEKQGTGEELDSGGRKKKKSNNDRGEREEGEANEGAKRRRGG